MFGHESKPSRIYSYGASVPTEGRESVIEQLKLAHRYRNNLVELELERRKRVDDTLAKLCPELAHVEVELAQREVELEQARTKKKAANAKERKRIKDPVADASITALREALKVLRARRKALRTSTFESEPWKAAQAEINEWAGGEQRKRRAECGLYWGTYLIVEQSMKGARAGAPPKFHRFDGGGRVAVQLQGGLSVDALLAAGDQRLRLELRPAGVWVPGKRMEKIEARRMEWRARRAAVSAKADAGSVPELAHCDQVLKSLEHAGSRKLGDAVAWIRIGSTDKGGPVWAKVPIHFHRELPPDATIKWAWLVCRRVGVHYQWRFQFVLSRDSWERPDAARSGTVGIDVGWRLVDVLPGAEPKKKGVITRPDDEEWATKKRLRVAVWAGDDGQTGELFIPRWWLREWERTETIRGHRDVNLTAVKEALVAWIAASQAPEWLKEETKTLHQWRSAGRLAALVIRWRGMRWDGDAQGYELAEAWRKRDKHLLSFECQLRDQLQNWRRNEYRNFAAQMRRQYATAIVEDLDLRQFHVLPKAEEESPDGALREHVRDACLSFLRQALTESMTVLPVPAQRTTLTCHECGSEEEWDRRELMHTCSSCRNEWDQDMNAARNLLASGSVVKK